MSALNSSSLSSTACLSQLVSNIRPAQTLGVFHIWSHVCPLCNAEKCTIHHVLCHCNFLLQNKRHTWWHGSVLSLIPSVLPAHIAEINKSNYVSLLTFISQSWERPHIVIWSPLKRRSIIVELTCPDKEGIENARSEKKQNIFRLFQRYSDNRNTQLTSWQLQ